jgi:hypothetical protein
MFHQSRRLFLAKALESKKNLGETPGIFAFALADDGRQADARASTRHERGLNST